MAGAQSAWVGDTKQTGEVLYVSPNSDGPPRQQRMTQEELTKIPVKTKRVVSISDTHGFHERLLLPKGDILIIGGDVSPQYAKIRDEEIISQLGAWCESQPYDAVIVIAGNHDPAFERLGTEKVQSILLKQSKKTTYLCHSATTVCGLSVYGTPSSYGQKWARGKNAAFQKPATAKRAEPSLFLDIPKGRDIVVTHQSAVGCDPLKDALKTACPRLHVGGHNHASYGVETVRGTLSITACTVNGKWLPVNLPIVVDV
eukprot:TRINITY_DN24075_c0_g1_i1.p1 TRINITY_DN24075_c0_g1~~TRINITY_DN24075_c0_g1_i1.p1  ORF type:complete len:266 (+),score=13.66 TRINITY_DN24075_c0_g1_i1:29-799(+)